MGYRRVVLAGQSAGAWVSMAATMRGASLRDKTSTLSNQHEPPAKGKALLGRAGSLIAMGRR